MTMNDIGKGAHVINNSHAKCMVGAFDKMLYEGFIWTGPKAVLYFSSTNKYFFTLYIMVENLLTNI